MKVEFVPSAFGIGPDMVIAGTEFKKILDIEDEFIALCFAVDAFTSGHGFENNLNRRCYNLARRWLTKNSSVMFMVKELSYSRIRSIRWCEIYVITDGKVQPVITSEDGENFYTHVPPIPSAKGKKNEVPQA